ncbi:MULTISPECIES: DUF1450 domain-containing protein [Haloferacaceae]|uniref:DUF1450 domain-containing protein n=1 Tax=Halorubrum glutamatedens TaxID=2707018 RepID=A0ABD5QQV5_9EURY|nr:DUF1450 domain-containing protein [Halobellus captivus]
MSTDPSVGVVQCCKRNAPEDLREVLDCDRYSLRETLCLQRCGECYETGFVVVDGTKVEFDVDRPRETLPAELRSETRS